MTTLIVNGSIVIASCVLMEAFAWAMHKYVMHSWGWRWHRSHHEPSRGLIEKNDYFAVIFGVFAVGIMALSHYMLAWLFWVGIGLSLYGLLYFIVHDGLTHARWPIRRVAFRGYLKRLVQAHRLHHAAHDHRNAVSYGFLYAPPVRQLKQELRAMQGHGGKSDLKD